MSNETSHWNKCTSCDYETVHQNHNFLPKFDDEKHWYECSCGLAVDEGSHDLSLERDNDGHWSFCHSCNYESEKVNHEYEYKDDAYNHWKECSCGNKIDLGTHDWEITFDNNSHYKRCKVCGRNDGGVCHSLEQKSNTEGHWKECKDCDYATEIESHNYSSNYKYDETGHWQVCSCGAKTAVEGHQLTHKYGADNHYDRCETCNYKTNVEAHCYEKYVELPDTGRHSVGCTGCNCTLCTQDHDFIDTHDNNNHWKECKYCHAVEDCFAHNLVCKNDSAEHWYECSCGYACDFENHDFEDKYDDHNHWKECKVCHLVKDVHENSIEFKNFGDGHFAECSACDFGDTFSTYAEHNYEYKYSKYSHWLECKCGASQTSEDHSLTYAYDSEGHTASCATCGYTSEKEEHDLVLKQNPVGHWYECTCGYKTDVAEHDYDYSDYDLSTHYCVCKTCEAHYDLEDHNYSVAKTTNTKHWNECACGAIDSLESHTLVNDYDNDYHWEKCTGCSHTTSKVAHDLKMKGDKYGHWYECDCGYKTELVQHEYDHSDFVARTHFDVCKICGERYNQYAHSFSTIEYNDEGHWHVCKCGAIDDPVCHTLTDVFDETGHWKRCTDCGYTTEKVPYNS